MADYIAKARSNYFKVKDEASFRKWAEDLNLEVEQEIRNGQTYFVLFPIYDHTNGWTWPTSDYRGVDEDEIDDPQELDIPAELSKHLQDGSVAVLLECGSEKLRYLTGEAVAVNSQGERVEMRLSDIYQMAKHLGGEITEASW